MDRKSVLWKTNAICAAQTKGAAWRDLPERGSSMNLLSITLTKNTPGQTQVYSIRIDAKPDQRFHVAIADHTLKGRLAIGTHGDHGDLKLALLQARACIVDRVQQGWTTLYLAVDPTIEPAFAESKVPAGRSNIPTRKSLPAATNPVGADAGMLNQLVPAGQVIRLFIEAQSGTGHRAILGADESGHWIELPARLKDLCACLPLGSGATVLDGIWTGCEFVATDMPTENNRQLLGLSLEVRMNLLAILIGKLKGFYVAEIAVTQAEKKDQWEGVQWDLGERLWVRPNKPILDSAEMVGEIPRLSQEAA